jgi:glutamyl-tRNA synthetase
VTVDFYREVGYLPDAIVNYLLLLGWSLDDKTEILSRREMVANFSLDRVSKGSASFDPQKLLSFEAQYMSRVAEGEKVAMTLPFLTAARLLGEPVSDEDRARVAAVVRAAGDRIVVAGDILEYRELFEPADRLAYDEGAFDKRLREPEEARALLQGYRGELATLGSFDAGTLEASLRSYVEAKGVKLGQVIHAVRVAATGKAVGFGMFETLEILGRAEVLARIDRALARL